MRKSVIVPAFLVIFLLMSAVSVFAQEKYVPTPNEEIYGTWINEKMNPPKEMKNPDGSFADYFPITYAKPFMGGTEEIFKRWTDSEGNVYYDTFVTYTFGSPMISRTQNFCKVSKSGTVLEVIWVSVSDFAPDKFPTPETEVNKMTSGYLIYYRAEE